MSQVELNLFAALFLLLFCHKSAQRPLLVCDLPSPSFCEIGYVNVTRDEPRYDFYANSSVAILQFRMHSSQLAVLSPDICETFGLLTDMQLDSLKIEAVHQDAFTACRYLNTINLSRNLIQVLPEQLFHQNLYLRTINLNSNRLIGISDSQFASNSELFSLDVENNHLAAFPASAVKNCTKLYQLYISTNDIFDINAEELIANLPRLSIIYPNRNLFLCSRLQTILNTFRSAGVSVISTALYKPPPIFRMTEIEFFTCIEGQ